MTARLRYIHPMTNRFCRYELRTLDDDAARQFYARLLGHERAIVWPLHEQARARGARPHWLGSIGVEDLPRVSEEFVKRGATVLAPARVTRDGGMATVLRDPGGAILGLVTTSECAATVDVSWHALNTNDVTAAIANYRALFDWKIADEPLKSPWGNVHELWWNATEHESAGAMADITDRPQVHPHWLFFFDVDALDAAVELTRQAGGTATDPIEARAGRRISICEDPQGAAFGLMERR
jgi:predicted enzyme related to lactoylglutathione lyase